MKKIGLLFLIICGISLCVLSVNYIIDLKVLTGVALFLIGILFSALSIKLYINIEVEKGEIEWRN